MSLREYILWNWTDSRFDRSFRITGYRKRLSRLLEKNTVLEQDIRPILSRNSLSRVLVFQWVEKSPYQGFLAGMIWGGISSATTRKHKVSNVDKAFSIPKTDIERILANVKKLLLNGKEEDAFDYLEKGDGKIDGIGVSYLTKILYFFSPNRDVESLIFDRWGRFMHAAMIIDDQNCNLNNYYSYHYKANFKSDLKPLKPEKELYLDYLSRMRNLANSIEAIPSPGHLEAFLFGDKLYKKNQNQNNPRFYLYNVIKQHYTSVNPGEITNGHTKLIPLKKIKVLNRVAEQGYQIITRNYNLFIIVGFVGKDKVFCDILSKTASFPKEAEIEAKGLIKRGKKKPYYVKKFMVSEMNLAKNLMEELKDALLGE